MAFNLLSANHTKWSNQLKQFVGNGLSVPDHFVGLVLKGFEVGVILGEKRSNQIWFEIIILSFR